MLAPLFESRMWERTLCFPSLQNMSGKKHQKHKAHASGALPSLRAREHVPMPRTPQRLRSLRAQREASAHPKPPQSTEPAAPPLRSCRGSSSGVFTDVKHCPQPSAYFLTPGRVICPHFRATSRTEAAELWRAAVKQIDGWLPQRGEQN